MEVDLKQKLMEQGASHLADALIRLSETLLEQAQDDERFQAIIAQFFEPSDEHFQDWVARIQQLNACTFSSSRPSAQLSHKIQHYTQQIQRDYDHQPNLAVDLLARLQRTDEHLIAYDPELREVYLHEVQPAYIRCAQVCEDQQGLITQLMGLLSYDPWQLRIHLWHQAEQFLTRSSLHALIELMQLRSQQCQRPAQRRAFYALIASLARQVQDAPLYAEAKQHSIEQADARAYSEIARVYLECGDAESALHWLNQALGDQ